MCFSAPASFTASAVLAGLGAVLIVRTKTKRLLPLASIPCFFAIQQCLEGFIWLSLPKETSAIDIYIFFALVFWPIWIPLSLWIAEPNIQRKYILSVFLGLGIVTGILLGLSIPGSTASMHNKSIYYSTNSNDLNFILYIISTLSPFFISSLKKTWIFGALAALFGLTIYAIDQYFFVSMWCFFAALLSLSLFLVINKK